MNYHTIMAAATVVAARTERENHDAAVILGSGLSDYAASLPNSVELPYNSIPGFPVPQVAGHGGSLYSVPVADRAVLFFAGRVHSYEGHPMADVVFAARTAAATGARRVLLTNAAGGVNDAYTPGDLVTISDHINLSGRNPLTGPNDDRLGPRFPDMTDVYSPALRARLRDIFDDLGIPFHEGVYAMFAGPTYETPAEVQMAKRMGADLVGMSTVPEAIALRHMGVEVAGISLVTNLAAGISPTPLSHDEVTETAATARTRFSAVLDALVPHLVAE